MQIPKYTYAKKCTKITIITFVFFEDLIEVPLKSLMYPGKKFSALQIAFTPRYWLIGVSIYIMPTIAKDTKVIKITVIVQHFFQSPPI